MNLIDFNNCIENDRHYGGNAGGKLGIEYNQENWFLKFPKSTKGFHKPQISYTTSPLSEYIGSNIYRLLDIPVHDTLLGVKNGKLVVACKDFLKQGDNLDEFKNIKNTYIEGMEMFLSNNNTSGSGTDLVEVLEVVKKNKTLQKIDGVSERFWDMFVVDAFIGNNDRNNGNWGVIRHFDGKIDLSPVYDNGNSFNVSSSDEQMLKILQDKNRLEISAIKSRICTYMEDGKNINPFSYMQSNANKDCIRSVKIIVPKIDLTKINSIIDDIPNTFMGIRITSDIQKDFYKSILLERYEKVLLPLYKREKALEYTKKEISQKSR